MTAIPGRPAADPLETAADWFSRERAGALPPEDARALAAWLAAAPGHLAAYRRIERQWAAFGGVSHHPAILAAREEDRRRHPRRTWARRATAAAAAAVAVLTIHQTDLPARIGLTSPGVQSFRNAVGQRSNVTLADGSVVTLDTDSEVRVLEMDRIRSLELVRGRAFFAVAKDRSRPFLVRAAGRTVHATGTEFVVKLADGGMTVTLVEGSVDVDQPQGLFRPNRVTPLRAGTQLETTPRRWTLSRFDRQRETGWLSGQLTFVQIPLKTAVAEVNRYSTRQLVFVNGKVPDRTIVGVFHAGDVDGLARAIELDGFARIVERGPDRIALSPEPQ